MNVSEWQLYRRIEMHEIKRECLRELDEELDAIKTKEKMSNTTFFAILISLSLFLVIFLAIFLFYPIELLIFFDSPFLKPIVLASPGIFGFYMNCQEKKKMNAKVKSLEKKYSNFAQ